MGVWVRLPDHQPNGASKVTKTELEELADRANVFYNDVITQIGGLCIQDYGNLNELGMLLTKREKEIAASKLERK